MPHKRKELKVEGSNLWYLVGLITSDGCLSSDGRHIDITSKDCNFLTELTRKLKIANRVCMKNKGTKKEAYRIQIANRNFYDFLMSIGLMQNKSLRLGMLDIPRKMAALQIIKKCYYDGCLGLQRKVQLAKNCLNSPRGWRKSRTVNF